MKTFLSIFFFFVYLNSIAQLTSEELSCQHKKQNQKFKAKSILDTRSDSIDITHTHLFIDITNWGGKTIKAKALINFTSKVNGLQNIALDLLLLQVDSVKQSGVNLNFQHNDTLLVVDLLSNLNQNQSTSIEVFYSGTPIQNAGDWGGFYWNNTYAFNIGVSFQEDPHNYGRIWFPCFDNFVERNTFEFTITTQDSKKAFCNGLLLSETNNGNGTYTWHLSLGQEIPSYLASLSVASYATVSDSYQSITGSNIPILLVALPVDTNNLKNSFIHLPDALACYEENYAPYAFDRVGYCITSFNAGAMEHATNITYMRAAVTGNTSNETLMAHELSHHWWGNYITCQTAEDMWLNEGWASYSEALFMEYVYGTEAYKDYSRENHDNVLRLTHINDGAYLPVSGVPTEQTYSGTVYDKGADMAHTIRGILGDDVFFPCIEDFLTTYAFKDVNSNQFEDFLSSCSGKDLSSFFDSWIFEKGFHHYSIGEIEIKQQGGLWAVEGSITQKLWENATYTSFLPIELSFFDENGTPFTQTITTYGPCSSFQLNIPFQPVYYALDWEEKIQDATVDEHRYLKQTGTENFELGRVDFDVQSITDSVLMHVTHHYIKPDAFQVPITGLHLSPNRYWSIGGVWKDGFTANATFKFNGSNNQTNGYLDNNFITNSEDSLVLLYKAKPSDDWSLVQDFTVNTQGSNQNKQGYIEVFDVKKGDYVLAIYNKNQAQDTVLYSPCIFTGIHTPERMSKLVNVFPIPSKDSFQVTFLDEVHEPYLLKVNSIIGTQVYEHRLKPTDHNISIETKDWATGTYLLNFHLNAKVVYSTKIIVE